MGRTALHYAIFKESSLSTSTAHSDSDPKTDVSERGRARERFMRTVGALLRARGGCRMCADVKREWTPLHQCVGGGSTRVLRLLIAQCTENDLIAQDLRGDSLLHIAVRYNRPRSLKILLTETHREWNLGHKNHDNETPLKLATMLEYAVCVRCLAECGAETEMALMKALLLAVKKELLNSARLFLRELKVDANFTDSDGMTPLRWAAVFGHREMTKVLLVNGARDDLDANGENVVFYAAKHSKLDILQLLKKANADFCVVNHSGQSATDKTEDEETVHFIKNVRNAQQQFQ